MDKFYPKSIEDLAKSAFEKEADDAISSSPANWDRMHQLLDQEMPQKRKKRRVVFWFFGFLMVGLLITGARRYFTGSNSTHVIKTVVNKNDHSSKQSPIIENKELNDSKAPTEQKLINHQKAVAKQKPKLNSAYKPHSKSAITFNSPIKSEPKSAIKSEPQSAINAESSEKPLKNADTERQLQAIVPEQNHQKQLDTVNLAKQDLQNTPIDSTTSKYERNSILAKDSTIEKVAMKIPEKKPSNWEWNLTVSPDFLLSNRETFYRPGFTVGVGINYLLSPKWRIRSGLLYNYTPVNASGDGYLYKPSPNLPSYTSLELRNVNGNLHVFEVPLSIRYTAQPNKKWSFISSVGLSSLFFIKQQYTYDLLLNGSTPLLWNSANDTDDDGESHILSNLTIGTGLSVKTKRNWVLEIEPMFKLPLEELGEGHNKLGTISLFFNLRMPILKQKK